MSNSGHKSSAPRPYSSTPIFDQTSLPDALRHQHDTKAGVWWLIRVLEGKLLLTVLDPPGKFVLEPGHPGTVHPQQPHFVTPLGPVLMRVDFYKEPPSVDHKPTL